MTFQQVSFLDQQSIHPSIRDVRIMRRWWFQMQRPIWLKPFIVSSQFKLAVEIPFFYEETTAVRTNHRLSDRCWGAAPGILTHSGTTPLNVCGGAAAVSKIAMTPRRLTVLVGWRHFVYANVAPRCVVVWSSGGGKYDTQELTFGYHQGKKIHESLPSSIYVP